MKLFELKERVDAIFERMGGDLQVMVVIEGSSMGARPMVQVKSISPGFDWEKGRAILTTVEPIRKQGPSHR